MTCPMCKLENTATKQVALLLYTREDEETKKSLMFVCLNCAMKVTDFILGSKRRSK